jgi:hypothetical protein
MKVGVKDTISDEIGYCHLQKSIECTYSNIDSPNAAISLKATSNLTCHIRDDYGFFYVCLGH